MVNEWLINHQLNVLVNQAILTAPNCVYPEPAKVVRVNTLEANKSYVVDVVIVSITVMLISVLPFVRVDVRAFLKSFPDFCIET